MSNHKARFRGDLQVDGSILGSDGEPIGGGGGAIDWATPIPELHFAGDPDDPYSGVDLHWDQDEYYGLVLSQPLGSSDAELYLINPDAPPWAELVNIYSTGMNIHSGGATFGASSGGIFANHPATNRYVKADLDGLMHRSLADGMASLDGVSGLALYEVGGWLSSTPTFQTDVHGKMSWGDGSGPLDTELYRIAPGTLEIDHTLSFKGADDDPLLGATLTWDDDFYGMMLKGRPGSGDAELYVANPDVAHAFANIYPSAFVGRADADNFIQVSAGESGSSTIRFASEVGETRLQSPGDGLLKVANEGLGVSGLVAHSPDGTAYKLTPPNGGGAATWVAA